MWGKVQVQCCLNASESEYIELLLIGHNPNTFFITNLLFNPLAHEL